MVSSVSKRAIFFVAVAIPYALEVLTPGHLYHDSKWQTTVVAFLAAFIPRFIWLSIIYPFYFSPLRHLPQPKQTSLLFGQMYRILTESIGSPQSQWMREIPNDGLIYYRTLFNTEWLVLTTPKALSDALTTKSYDLIKPPIIVGSLTRILGASGILLTENEEHKHQRKNLLPAFQYRHVKNLYPVFWEKARDMILAIDKELSEKKSGGPDPSNIVSVDHWTSRATLDIIGLAGIGKSFNAIEDETNELYQSYQTIFAQDRQARILGVLNTFFPFWLVRKLPFPRNYQIVKAQSMLQKMCLDLIGQKRAKSAAAEKEGSKESFDDMDILGIALKSGGFSDQGIIDQLMTFLAAGHETTATAMTWALLALCKHPDVDQIAYLQAVMNEVLRVYTPVPATFRVAQRDTTICNQFVPKGTMVLTSSVGTNHLPTLWGNDCDEFNPDRWLDESGRANTSGGAESNYANMTFSHGPRGCIGASFAKGEFACLLAAWVLAYDSVLVNEDMNVEKTPGIVSRIKDGLDVKLTPLQT
ncbi:cytochrome P450 monooxygenase [Aureobasidium sp. EXF-10727]|nr:cytochrome P450 monooxygenase [Aureobasidium sp. EXF-10727]